ncbi:GNAT family N-acetyltransferase [Clostridium lacusfryxellense]|uniref:GNAT family N-acetyltransferase n=1 Tax=Clostridium lacusfryxellense TaxID=205328 RepID=UPI001C0E52C9|nr:GNAT family N-acetyltransferase [Clostridium lacusfryxellense]MBU3113071.1 GNAT family N-acetyltransferase [Clostridium lacusfryxellense]
MEFSKAVEADVNSIMKIINKAQAYFKQQDINQWQDNYPNFETVINDINNGNGYVLLEDNNVIGTVVFTFDGEKNYEVIYNGKWINNDKYAVIHRMAVDSNYKGMGLASIIIKNIEEICLDNQIYSIRIDTHIENISMKKMLLKNGFEYCGIIYLDDQSKRVAYEKTL